MRMAGNDLTEVGVTRGLWAGRVGVGTAVQAGGRGKGPVASVDGGDERVHAVTARRRPKSRERLTHFMAILSAPRIRGVAMAPPNGLELSRPASSSILALDPIRRSWPGRLHRVVGRPKEARCSALTALSCRRSWGPDGSTLFGRANQQGIDGGEYNTQKKHPRPGEDSHALRAIAHEYSGQEGQEEGEDWDGCKHDRQVGRPPPSRPARRPKDNPTQRTDKNDPHGHVSRAGDADGQRHRKDEKGQQS